MHKQENGLENRFRRLIIMFLSGSTPDSCAALTTNVVSVSLQFLLIVLL